MQDLRFYYSQLPKVPGIYLFLDEKGSVLYVGKAKNLRLRVASYFSKQVTGEKTKLLISKICKIKTIQVDSEIESLLLEANFIKKHKPNFNIRLADGKAYPLIRITIKDTYPKVLVARKISDPKSEYFGPYPNTGAMRLVLRTIRKIFPFQSVFHHPKKLCLYYHLGLCPCPEVFDDKTYRKNIYRIIQFLQGKTKTVLHELEKVRDTESKNEHYEKAQTLQKKIDAMKLIIHPVHKPFEYETNPNLLSDLRKKELSDLSFYLQRAGVRIGTIKKIECFDISNTSGTNATGSMVVFTNGKKDTDQYRRFKIRLTFSPNDVAMISEVMQRRLNHPEWGLPDLIIVDGGKAQISAALKALHEAGISIPVIGLAKREEIIITSDFREIRLPRDSAVLHLVMRIRDEAHRFAITYHRILRSKLALKS